MAKQQKPSLASKISADSYLKFFANYNPTRVWFAKNNVSYEFALSELSMVAEVEAALIARRNAVLGSGWDIVGKNEAQSALIKNSLSKAGAVNLFNAVFDAVWYGFAVLDTPIVKEGGTWLYQSINSLPAHWFSFDENSILVFGRPARPVNLQQGDIAKEAELIRYLPSYLNPYGESQLARVFWPATWLKGGFEYWASYISRFGDDSIIAHTDGGDANKKHALLQDILNFRSSGGMVVEGTDTFEILKTEKTSSSTLFKDFALACRESISRLLLGHSSALDSTPGKLGGEQNIALVRDDIASGDKRLIEGAVNSLIAHIAQINHWADKPVFAFSPEAESEASRIARDKELHAMGLRFSPSYYAQNYRLAQSDFTIQEALQSLPAFSAPDSETPDAELKAFESSIESCFKGIKSPFYACNKALLTALQKAEYWEDAFAAILQNPPNTPADSLHLALLQANAIGRVQVQQRVDKLTAANFADRTAQEPPPYFDGIPAARNWFTKKTNLSPEEYSTLDGNLKQYAFTVSGLAKNEHIADIAAKLLQSYDEGQSYREFKKNLQPLGSSLDSISDRRLQLMFYQNTFSAYSEGRYKQMMQASSIMPNWEYITTGDDRVRPSHAALNGTVRRYDDPFWQTYYPPNGFNCRCMTLVSTKPLTEGSIGAVPPPMGFDKNPAAYDYFIGDKLLKSYGSLAEWQRALNITGQDKRVSLIGNKQAVSLSGAGKELPLFENSNLGALRSQAEESLKFQGRDYLTVFDKKGNPVFIGKDMIRHITEDGHDPKDSLARLRYFKSIEKLIAEADAGIEDIVRYKDNGRIVFQRYYYTKVNNKTITVVAQWIRKDGENISASIPAGATLIIQSGKIIQTGIRIF